MRERATQPIKISSDSGQFSVGHHPSISSISSAENICKICRVLHEREGEGQ